ncbi:MAG: energy-coupling factor transporter transmembrane protein EcfT [Sulfuricella denitrificans]|nr:energy-coupling factor transporter transmembrane protein EcfT [Sulfuricella denitrificans]
MPSTDLPWGAFCLRSISIFQFHPATKILLWLGFAIVIQGSGVGLLGMFSLVVAALLLAGRSSGLLVMVRRARWLLLSLLLIYSFVTPGDALIPGFGPFSPTLQGLSGGAMQAWRLLLLLIALGLLLRSCLREDLLSGLYVLMRPFRVIGFNADRLAVRLWLTLQYAEGQQGRNVQAWWSELRSTLDTAAEAETEITLELQAFRWRDVFVLMVAVFLIGFEFW